MIYGYSIDISKYPAWTESAPQVTHLLLNSGNIHQLDIEFPSGCGNRVGVRFKRGGFQIWPSNSNEWFKGDGSFISFKENYPMTYEPYIIQVETCNYDSSYDHTVVIRIGLLRAYLGQKLTSFDDLIFIGGK